MKPKPPTLQAKALAKVIPECSQLSQVNLADNSIGAEGAVALAGVLAQCTGLTSLNLERNSIRDTLLFKPHLY